MSERRRARLRARALRTLTQGHLSQHVFFHVFHHPEVGAQAAEVFGTTPMSYLTLRRAGYTPAEIGTLNGRSRAQTGRAIERVWRATARRGAMRLQTPRTQARRFADHQASMLSRYLDSSLHPKGPGGPPPPSTAHTPGPHLRLLCTIFAGTHRASNPVNYGADAVHLVLRSRLGLLPSSSVAVRGTRPTPCTLRGAT